MLCKEKITEKIYRKFYRKDKIILDNGGFGVYNKHIRETAYFADVAHPVERHLAKVEVASSSLVIRSKKNTVRKADCVLFGLSSTARLERSNCAAIAMLR